jgi:hypothetical protein
MSLIRLLGLTLLLSLSSLALAGTDGDGVPDSADNCPRSFNPNQFDSNSDGIGDLCDVDSDGVPDQTFYKIESRFDRTGEAKRHFRLSASGNCIASITADGLLLELHEVNQSGISPTPIFSLNITRDLIGSSRYFAPYPLGSCDVIVLPRPDQRPPRVWRLSDNVWQEVSSQIPDTGGDSWSFSPSGRMLVEFEYSYVNDEDPTKTQAGRFNVHQFDGVVWASVFEGYGTLDCEYYDQLGALSQLGNRIVSIRSCDDYYQGNSITLLENDSDDGWVMSEFISFLEEYDVIDPKVSISHDGSVVAVAHNIDPGEEDLFLQVFQVKDGRFVEFGNTILNAGRAEFLSLNSSGSLVLLKGETIHQQQKSSPLYIFDVDDLNPDRALLAVDSIEEGDFEYDWSGFGTRLVIEDTDGTEWKVFRKIGPDAYPNISIEGFEDTDRDGKPNSCDSACLDLGMRADEDNDGDGYPNELDPQPNTANLFLDSDDDGIADYADLFPYDPTEDADSDGDAIGNNADEDDDNDGYPDLQDAFPTDAAEYIDTDGDRIGNNSDLDDDGDGVNDVVDFYPLDPMKFEYCCQKALIVAGGGPYFGNVLWPATKNMASFAYETLKFQGLKDEDIVYLSEEESNLVDGLPTKEQIRAAILGLTESESEAVEHVLIYMVDHGGEEVFKLDESTLLEAQELGAWIDEMHAQFDGKSTLVYDACESGSFVSVLAAEGSDNRLVLTSSAPKEAAVFALNGYSSYSYAFWSSFYVGNELHDSHTLASRAMGFVWDQNAQADADGDGIPNTKADKIAIRKFEFGQRAARASDNPILGEIDVQQELFGVTEAQLNVDKVVGGTRVKAVFAYINDPDEYFSSPDEPVLAVKRSELKENEDGSWSGLLTGFDILGSYEVTVIAENMNGLFSIPSESDTVKIIQFKGRDPIIEDSEESVEQQDADGDGIADSADAFPLDATETVDTDSDGTGNNADTDDDNDGVEDTSDAFPLDAGEASDSDNDGVGNNSDAFPDDATESLDSDSDSVGDNADNCSSLSNSDQLNTDGDAEGDACDSDDDNDGFSDDQEELDGTNPKSRFSCKSGCFSFDVDENLEAQPLTDGLLVIRHLFGFSGESLTSGAVSGEASRGSSEAIAGYLTDADSQLDIDGDGESKPLTDGLLLIRYLFGFSGDSLISGAIGDGAERDTAEEVEAYIKERIPAN